MSTIVRCVNRILHFWRCLQNVFRGFLSMWAVSWWTCVRHLLFISISIWAASWQNQQNGMCAQRRQIRLGGSELSLWSGWADAQADMSLRWAHKPFCWFVTVRLIWHTNSYTAICLRGYSTEACHAVAQKKWKSKSNSRAGSFMSFFFYFI